MLHALLGIVLFANLCSCGTIELPDSPTPQAKAHKVTIVTRAAQQEDLNLPIEVVAFSDAGAFVTHQRLTKPEDKLSLSLAEGHYRLVAFSGMGNVEIPQAGVELTSAIAMRDLPHPTLLMSTAAEESSTSHPATSPYSASTSSAAGIAPERSPLAQPLMRGEAEIDVEKKRSTVEIVLSHATSAVEFRLQQVPTPVKQVRITLANVYSTITWGGQYAASTPVTLIAQRGTDGTWGTGIRYVFPSVGDNITATLTFVDETQEQNFAYRLGRTFSPGTPYRFQGTYEAETSTIRLAGVFSATAWKPWVEEHFSFGKSQDNTREDLPTPTPTEPSPLPEHPTPQPPAEQPHPITPPSQPSLKGFPQVGTLWQGKFLVAQVKPLSNEEADVMLLAKEQLEDAASARSTEGDARDAVNYANEYSEDGLSGWSVPTKAEAEILATAFHDATLVAVNQVLRSIRGQEIYDEIAGKKVKYLCNDGELSFSFFAKPNFRAGTAKSKGYLVRCVKHVRIRKTA